jgi:hypothetical protein
MSKLQDILYRALVSAQEIDKNMNQWRQRPVEAEAVFDTHSLMHEVIPERKPLYQEFRELTSDLFGKYRMSIFESNVLFMLGKYMSEDVSKISILDVGSGSGKMAKALLSQIKPSVQVQYTSIDYQVVPVLESVENAEQEDPLETEEAKINRYFRKGKKVYLDSVEHIEHEHHSVDALEIEDAELCTTLGVGEGKKVYDLIIIDIEPHGSEIRLYEKFQTFLKEEHICIIPHCFIRTFGPWFAGPFLTKFIELGHIIDYYAQDLNCDMNDMYMVMKRTPLCEKTIFKCQSLTKGLFYGYIADPSKCTVGRRERILEFIPGVTSPTEVNLPDIHNTDQETGEQLDQCTLLQCQLEVVK